MPIAAALIAATLLASGVQTPAPGAPSQQPQSQDDPGAPSSTTERPHEMGLGGFGGSGGGPSFRYFFGEQIGVEVSGGWYRPMTAGGGSQGTSFQVSPSMVVMLRKSNTLADLDLRPYVGGGIIYMNAPATVATRAATATRQDGLGMQAFGGVEMTFASAPSLAISAELIYHKLPIESYNVNLNRGVDFYLLFHYYMR